MIIYSIGCLAVYLCIDLLNFLPFFFHLFSFIRTEIFDPAFCGFNNNCLLYYSLFALFFT